MVRYVSKILGVLWFSLLFSKRPRNEGQGSDLVCLKGSQGQTILDVFEGFPWFWKRPMKRRTG